MSENNNKELLKEAEELDEEIHRLEQKRFAVAKELQVEEGENVEELFTERLELVREIVDNPVPSILTVSLREIITFYGENIVKLQAQGGDFPSRTVVLDDDYGVTFIPGNSGTIRVDYTQERFPDGTIKNPINDDWINKMLNFMNTNLVEYEGHPPDIPVTFLEVEIIDDRIAELTGAETNIFDATFESESMEPRIKGNVRSSSEDRDNDLVDHWLVLLGQGFQMRNLNLMRLIERAIKFSEPKKVWQSSAIIQWGGFRKQDTHPKSPIEVAGRIRDDHLPPKFALLKTYRVMRGNKLVLDGVR